MSDQHVWVVFAKQSYASLATALNAIGRRDLAIEVCQENSIGNSGTVESRQ